jgi:hypothetical protein
VCAREFSSDTALKNPYAPGGDGGGILMGSESPSSQVAVTGGGPPTPGGVPMCDPVIGNPVLTGTVNGSTYSGTWATSGSSVGSAFGTSGGRGSFTLTKQ